MLGKNQRLTKTLMLDFDFEKICRVCLQADLCLSPLFDHKNSVDGVPFCEMISECTTYSAFSGDVFPQLICYECIEKLRSAYNFKKQYESSHRLLVSFLESNHKSKDMDIEENISKCDLIKQEKCDIPLTEPESVAEINVSNDVQNLSQGLHDELKGHEELLKLEINQFMDAKKSGSEGTIEAFTDTNASQISPPLLSYPLFGVSASNRPSCNKCRAEDGRRRKTRFTCIKCRNPVCAAHSHKYFTCNTCILLLQPS